MSSPDPDVAALPALIRPAAAGDFAQIQPIYAHHVLHGLASFEEVPPSVDEMLGRFESVGAAGLPYLAAELGGRIAGYGYCSPYRTRSAYRHTLEDSVYVRDGLHGRGIGRALLAALIERCTALGYRQMLAVIGDSAHAPSIRLHAGAGFLRVGTFRSVGYKFGRWVDTVLMQRPLGPGDGPPPPAK